MQYSEGDVAMLTCSDEYNETIVLSAVLYNHSMCSYGDKYGIRNLCDGRTSCSFDVTNSNIGSSCGADGEASLQVCQVRTISAISWRQQVILEEIIMMLAFY
jgi:hypothetical protein